MNWCMPERVLGVGPKLAFTPSVRENAPIILPYEVGRSSSAQVRAIQRDIQSKKRSRPLEYLVSKVELDHGMPTMEEQAPEDKEDVKKESSHCKDAKGKAPA